jgi:hypothetical protein
MNGKMSIVEVVLVAACLLFILGTCCGCGNWALVHKSQFHETHENFITYRAHVAPTDEPEKVNELADLIEKWFETWKEGYDAQESGRSD